MTIRELGSRFRERSLSPVQIVEQCLEQIDKYEPHVRAWVTVERDEAIRQAQALADELQQGRDRGPLHGIPIGVKDIFDVADWPTAAGSERWANSIARSDATCIRKLRQAGVVLLGKTVTTQFASFDPPPTRNPWNPERTPGGSSSGSAAAVACGMCVGATASQTGGSITRPASYCGVAGVKPTYGRVALGGIVPLAESMDHPGMMATSVEDLALLLQAMAGPDHADPSAHPRAIENYARILEHGKNRPPRFGRVRGLFETMADDEMTDLIDRIVAQIGGRGGEVVELNLPASFADVLHHHRIVMAVECAAFHKERFEAHPEDYLPNIRALIEEGLACPAAEYARAKEAQRHLRIEMDAIFNAVDVLLAPATRGAAPTAETTGDPAFNSPWSFTGLPVISMPAGWNDDGLPLAVQLIGPKWGEARVFSAAAWLERTIDLERRTPPLP